MKLLLIIPSFSMIPLVLLFISLSYSVPINPVKTTAAGTAVLFLTSSSAFQAPTTRLLPTRFRAPTALSMSGDGGDYESFGDWIGHGKDPENQEDLPMQLPDDFHMRQPAYQHGEDLVTSAAKLYLRNEEFLSIPVVISDSTKGTSTQGTALVSVFYLYCLGLLDTLTGR